MPQVLNNQFDIVFTSYGVLCWLQDLREWANVIQPVHYEWRHTLDELFSAIINSGLEIQSFHEYPVCMYQKFEWLVRDRDGWWRVPEGRNVAITLLFSLKARRK